MHNSLSTILSLKGNLRKPFNGFGVKTVTQLKPEKVWSNNSP